MVSETKPLRCTKERKQCLTHSLTHSVTLVHLCRTRSTRTQQCTLTLLVCPQPSSGFLLFLSRLGRFGGPLRCLVVPSLRSAYDAGELPFEPLFTLFEEVDLYAGYVFSASFAIGGHSSLEDNAEDLNVRWPPVRKRHYDESESCGHAS